MGVLTNSDGSVKVAGVLITIGLPLLSTGYYRYGQQGGGDTGQLLTRAFENEEGHSSMSFFRPQSGYFELVAGMAAIVMGSVLCCSSIRASKDDNGVDERNCWIEDKSTKAEQLLIEIKRVLYATEKSEGENRDGGAEPDETNGDDDADAISICFRCLGALTNQCAKSQKRKSKKISSGGSVDATTATKQRTDDDVLETSSQEACYLLLKHFPRNEKIVSSCLFLLALISKNDTIRQRHNTTRTSAAADDDGTPPRHNNYGLETPITTIRDALRRAKSAPSPTEDEEHSAAELQRRACLFLGAVADGDAALASLVVREGGLAAVLEAVEWYRFHEDVGNWALWAVFVLCFDHAENQVELIRAGGIAKICRVMGDIPQSLGVQRHGIAILFDLMREVPKGGCGGVCERRRGFNDPVTIRLAALNANMHEVVRLAMVTHSKSVEIMMMGRQMLVATGFEGEIPHYDGALVKKGRT